MTDWRAVALFALPFIGLYLTPTVFAAMRKHPNLAPIAIVNVFLGWTFVGWVAALAWSVAAFRR
jgi:hypothetical protein